MTDISKLRALHAAATPGTWKKGETPFHTAINADENGTEWLVAENITDADRAFMVAAHAEWNGLLDSLEQASKDEAEFVRMSSEYEAEVESLRAMAERFAAQTSYVEKLEAGAIEKCAEVERLTKKLATVSAIAKAALDQSARALTAIEERCKGAT